jgi:hypothetical protein
MLTTRDMLASITPMVPKMIGTVCESSSVALKPIGISLASGVGKEHVGLGVAQVVVPDMSVVYELRSIGCIAPWIL